MKQDGSWLDETAEKSKQPDKTMNTPVNPYRYESNETCLGRGHSDDHSGFSCVIKIPRDPENPGPRERNLGRSLFIVLFVHVAVIAAIFIFHNWQHLMSDFLDLISKLADLRNPITGG